MASHCALSTYTVDACFLFEALEIEEKQRGPFRGSHHDSIKVNKNGNIFKLPVSLSPLFWLNGLLNSEVSLYAFDIFKAVRGFLISL
jgi:hypothetical protein